MAHSVGDDQQFYGGHHPQLGGAGGGLCEHEVDSTGVAPGITSDKSVTKGVIILVTSTVAKTFKKQSICYKISPTKCGNLTV